MFHSSKELKNKHQKGDETLSQAYLYKNHTSRKNSSGRLYAETMVELDDDIYFMRRQFKRTVRKLRNNLYFSNWLKNMPEKDVRLEYARLHPHRAQ